MCGTCSDGLMERYPEIFYTYESFNPANKQTYTTGYTQDGKFVAEETHVTSRHYDDLKEYL